LEALKSDIASSARLAKLTASLAKPKKGESLDFPVDNTRVSAVLWANGAPATATAKLAEAKAKIEAEAAAAAAAAAALEEEAKKPRRRVKNKVDAAAQADEEVDARVELTPAQVLVRSPVFARLPIDEQLLLLQSHCATEPEPTDDQNGDDGGHEIKDQSSADIDRSSSTALMGVTARDARGLGLPLVPLQRIGATSATDPSVDSNSNAEAAEARIRDCVPLISSLSLVESVVAALLAVEEAALAHTQSVSAVAAQQEQEQRGDEEGEEGEEDREGAVAAAAVAAAISIATRARAIVARRREALEPVAKLSFLSASQWHPVAPQQLLVSLTGLQRADTLLLSCLGPLCLSVSALLRRQLREFRQMEGALVGRLKKHDPRWTATCSECDDELSAGEEHSAHALGLVDQAARRQAAAREMATGSNTARPSATSTSTSSSSNTLAGANGITSAAAPVLDSAARRELLRARESDRHILAGDLVCQIGNVVDNRHQDWLLTYEEQVQYHDLSVVRDCFFFYFPRACLPICLPGHQIFHPAPTGTFCYDSSFSLRVSGN
jgi:hypothetical protein